MEKVICDLAGVCEESENCGGAEPHLYQDTECNQCPVYSESKCIDVEENMVKKYRKKPVVIEAIQFTNQKKDQCFDFVRCHRFADVDADKNLIMKIQTLEGIMRANINDWIIKGVSGEFYPCKPDIFEKTYEQI